MMANIFTKGRFGKAWRWLTGADHRQQIRELRHSRDTAVRKNKAAARGAADEHKSVCMGAPGQRAVLSLLCVAVLALAGCPSVPVEYAEADAATLDTAGVEWLELVRAAVARGELTQEQFERRERKFFAWVYRTEAELGRKLDVGPRPTERELAEATAKDLETLPKPGG